MAEIMMVLPEVWRQMEEGRKLREAVNFERMVRGLPPLDFTPITTTYTSGGFDVACGSGNKLTSNKKRKTKKVNNKRGG